MTLTAGFSMNASAAQFGGVVLDSIGTLGSLQALCKVGTTIFVPLNTSNNLRAFDASDPSNLSVISTLVMNPYGSLPSHIATNGSTYAYVAGNGNLACVNISNPAAMTVTGNVTSGPGYLANPKELAYSGGYCYIPSSTANRLTVVDVSTPSAPTVVGTVLNATSLASPYGVVYDGGYCYVSATGRLTVVDVSTPSAPTVAASLSGLPSTPYSICKIGSYIYRVSLSTISVIDISTPTSPTLAGSVSTSAGAHGGDNVGIAYDAARQQAYLTPTTGFYVRVLRVSTPSTPIWLNLLDAFVAGAAEGRQAIYDGANMFFVDQQSQALYALE
jgi:hypothetical protein